MKTFNEWLSGKLEENQSADGFSFKNHPIATQQIASTVVSLVPIDFEHSPSYGERSSDFGLLIKNQHGEAKAYLSPNKSVAMNYYNEFISVFNHLVAQSSENEVVVMKPHTLDKLLAHIGVR